MLQSILRATVALALLASATAALAQIQVQEKRIALVVGNAAYQGAPRATAANDAGLVAQTLQAAGFDVVGARDLDEDALRRSLRDFVDKAAASGPDTVAFVYVAGYGLQLEGENYLAPVDLRISTAADVAVRAVRVSDYAKSLAALPLKARFVVLDAAYGAPFAVPDKPLAGGLALTEAEPGSLVAFNAAPGTIGPSEKGPYGAYAQALVEMIRQGGLAPAELFERVRLRVDDATKGAAVPWHAARIDAPFRFFERAPDAPPASPAETAALRDKPLRQLGARDAYAVCLSRDDLAHYQEFVAAYPDDAMTKRVRALIAARREATVWRRTTLANTPEAYWSYLGRYPRGPHAWDARRRLASFAVALAPPPTYVPIVYDVPPPPPDEIVYLAQPALFLDDPVYALPPPPPPVFLLPPPAFIVELAPPPPSVVLYALPTPLFVPIPTYVNAMPTVVSPPNNVYYSNIHDTTVINQINRQILQPPPAGLGQGAGQGAGQGIGQPGGGQAPAMALGAGAVAGAALGAAAAHVALPPALQRRVQANPAAVSPGQPVAPGQAARPGQPGPPLPGQPALRPGDGPSAATPQALPGMNGQPLPGRPGAGSPAGAPRPGETAVPATGQAGRPAQAPQAAPLRPGQPGPSQRPAAAGPGGPQQAVDRAALRQAQAAQRAAMRDRAQENAARRAEAMQAMQQRRAAQGQGQGQAQAMAQRRAMEMQQSAQRQQAMAAARQQQQARAAAMSQQRAQMGAQRAQMMQAQRMQQMQRMAPRPAPQAPQARAPAPRPACRPGQPCR